MFYLQITSPLKYIIKNWKEVNRKTNLSKPWFNPHQEIKIEPFSTFYWGEVTDVKEFIKKTSTRKCVFISCNLNNH